MSPAAVPAAPVRSRAPAAATAGDDDDIPAEASFSEESFESSTTVVPRVVLADRDVARGDDRTPLTALKPPPPLEELVAKIPPETRDALEQLFRARFRAVRRITPEQLR